MPKLSSWVTVSTNFSEEPTVSVYTLKMVVAVSSETRVPIYHTTGCHFSGYYLNGHHHENLKHDRNRLQHSVHKTHSMTTYERMHTHMRSCIYRSRKFAWSWPMRERTGKLEKKNIARNTNHLLPFHEFCRITCWNFRVILNNGTKKTIKNSERGY
jgi:hypothetical protein